MIVIDASIALAWVFSDEGNEETQAILDQVGEHGASVPPLWALEVANALLMAERRSRLSRAAVEENLSLLAALDLAIADLPTAEPWKPALLLARAHGLTVYDAAYLDLAVRLKLPLATLDKELRQAAVALNVPVLPEPI